MIVKYLDIEIIVSFTLFRVLTVDLWSLNV